MNFRIAQAALFLWVAWMLWSTDIWSADPWLLLPCVLLAVLASRLTFRWIGLGAAHVPLGEAYCLLHFIYYLVPLLDEREAVLAYSSEVISKALFAVCVFLGSLQVSYQWVMRHSLLSEKSVWQSRVPDQRESALVWVLFWLWCLFRVVLSVGLLPDVGGALNAVRTVFTAGGTFAVFFLAHRLGRGTLARGEKLLLFAGLAGYLFMEFTSGFLVGGATVLMAALLAYTMASKHLPIIAGLCVALVLSFLHAGKGEYRAEYWDAAADRNEAGRDPLKAYSHWLEASWEASFSADAEKPASTGLIERGSLLQLLALVVQETPAKLPYLHGLTYRQLGTLLTPRLLWPDKPRGTLPSETLGIYYGYQTEESVEKTSIGLGQIGEAWSNFGWFGIIAAGAVIGLIFGKGASLSVHATPSQSGFILAALMVPVALDLEHCLAQVITILIQTLAVGSILIVLLRIATGAGSDTESPAAALPATRGEGSVPPP